MLADERAVQAAQLRAAGRHEQHVPAPSRRSAPIESKIVRGPTRDVNFAKKCVRADSL